MFKRFKGQGCGRTLGFAAAMLAVVQLPAVAAEPAPPPPSPPVAQDSVLIEGSVTEAGGDDPVRGARVTIAGSDHRTVTDTHGAFRLEGLAPGTYMLRVDALGYRPAEKSVEVGPGGIRVEIPLTPEPLGMEEVTATGTPLRGTAPVQPSRAYAGPELTRRVGSSFGEMLDGEPGLAMRSFGPVAGRPVIRGLDGDRVAVLEGGQRMGDLSATAHDHAVAMEPLLANRVEVVRGPSSLVYGSNALGGVVNLLRQNVPSNWAPGLDGDLSLQGASVNRLAAGAASARHGGGHWGATARASFRNGSDFRAPGTPDGVLDGTHNRLATAGGGLAWRGNGLRGGVGVDLHDHVYGVPEELDDPDEEVEIRSERQRLTGELDRRRTNRFFENVEVRFAASRFSQQEAEIEAAPDGGRSEEIEHDFEQRAVDLDLTATHGALGPVSQGAVGLSLLGSSFKATGAEEFHPDVREVALSLFTFQEVPLTERTDLQTGVRLEHDRTRATENLHFPHFSARRHATTLSGSVGLRTHPVQGLEVGAQLARAHRSPRLEQLYADGPHLGAGRYEVGDSGLPNEVGHGVDLLVRYQRARVQGEVAAFANWIDDFVFPLRTEDRHEESGLPVVRWTATGARFVGGEASLELSVTPTLRLRATGDLVRARRTDQAGTALPFIPPARGSVGAVYDRSSWWLGGTGRVAARQDRVPESQEPTAGYALLDLQAGARLGDAGQHELIVRVDNAFDTVYRDHLSRVDERRFPMPGRNLSAVYRWRF